MGRDCRKFFNPEFIEVADLQLVKQLLEHHRVHPHELLAALDRQDEEAARKALGTLLRDAAEGDLPDELYAELHKVVELGSSKGLQIILAQADALGIKLFPELRTPDSGSLDCAQEPRNIALRVLVQYRQLFEAASNLAEQFHDDRTRELVGEEPGVLPVTTPDRIDQFSKALADWLVNNFRGGYCSVELCNDGEELTLLIEYSSTVAMRRLATGRGKRVECDRPIIASALRYSARSGLLKVENVEPGLEETISEQFASIILGRPGFFGRATSLYSIPTSVWLDGGQLDSSFDPLIRSVEILGVTWGPPHLAANLNTLPETPSRSTHPNAATMADALGCPKEVCLAVMFEGRTTPVLVTISEARLSFRRAQFEPRIYELLYRNRFTNDNHPAGLTG